jgi:hypothetical protein
MIPIITGAAINASNKATRNCVIVLPPTPRNTLGTGI